MNRIVVMKCCEWMRLVQSIYAFCELAPARSAQVLSDEEFDLMTSAADKLCKNAMLLSLCNSTSGVLFLETEADVLVKVISFYAGNLNRNIVLMTAIDPDRTAKMKAEFSVIINNLQGYESEIQNDTSETNNCTYGAANLN